MSLCSLAGLLAKELRADLLVLMTDVAGLYTGLPTDPDSDVIPTYCPELHDSLIEYGSSSHGGIGGMVAKVCSSSSIPNTFASSHQSLASALQKTLMKFVACP